jgi:ABC-type Fe3+-hydroxamate transport system substrate-binding protein
MRLLLYALMLLAMITCMSCSSNWNSEDGGSQTASGTAGVVVASDECPRDDNQIIHLEPGDRVQIYQRVVPVDPANKALPPDSPMSKKLNLSYVKVLNGPHINEYCWASTVNVQAR